MNEILLKIPYESKNNKKTLSSQMIFTNARTEKTIQIIRKSKNYQIRTFCKNSHRHLRSRDLSGREDEEHKAIFATIHDKLAKIGSSNYLSFCTNLKKDERIQ